MSRSVDVCSRVDSRLEATIFASNTYARTSRDGLSVRKVAGTREPGFSSFGIREARGAVTTTLPTCHMVILEDPAKVAEVIDAAAKKH